MSPVPDLRLSVPGGVGVPAPFALVPGTKLGPVAVGSEGDWRIDATGVPPLACYLLFDGQTLFVSAVSAAVSVGARRVGREWHALSVPTDVQIGAATLSVVPGLETTRFDAVAVRGSPLPPRPRGVAAATLDEGPVTRATVVAPRPRVHSPAFGEVRDARPREKTARLHVLIPCALIGVAAACAIAGDQLRGDPLWGLRHRPAPQARISAPARTSPPPAATTVAALPQPSQPPPTSSVSTAAPGVRELAPVKPLAPKAGAATGTASAASARTTERSLEQRAVDAAAHGSYGVAALMYDELARENPDVPAYAEAARILAEPRH